MSEPRHHREPGDMGFHIGAEARTPRPATDMRFRIDADPDLSWLSEPDAEPESKPKTAQASSLGAGYLILVARELTGLSQRKLAAKAGTSQPALAKLETGTVSRRSDRSCGSPKPPGSSSSSASGDRRAARPTRKRSCDGASPSWVSCSEILTTGSPTSSCCANRARSKVLADAYPSAGTTVTWTYASGTS